MSIHYALWARNTYERPGKWLCKGRKSKKHHTISHKWMDMTYVGFIMAAFNGLHVLSSLQVTNVDWKHVSSMSLYSWSILIRPSCDSVKPPSSPNKTYHVTTGLTKVRWIFTRLIESEKSGRKKTFPKLQSWALQSNSFWCFFAWKNNFPRCSPQIHRDSTKKSNPTSQLLNLKSRLNAKTCHSPDGRLIEIGRGALPTPKHDSIGIIGTFAMSKHLTLIYSWPNIGVTLAWRFHVII